MKVAILITLAAMFVLGSMAVAETATAIVYSGLNLVGAPLVPLPLPGSTYGVADPRDVFMTDVPGVRITVNQRLVRWNAPTQGYITYSTLPGNTFGKVLLGDGMWLKRPEIGTVVWQYNGVANGVPDSVGTKTDMWISLPKAGLTLFGHPFKDQVTWSNCKITDGTTTKTIAQAVSAGWTNGWAVGWNPTTQGYYSVGWLIAHPNKKLDAYRGFWIKTNVDNLALIIPAVNP